MNEDNQRGSEVGGGENAAGIWARGQKVGGIDVGSKQHWVCAPAREGEGREVQVFEATTPALEKMAAWLLERRVESVALESTGVYWIPVYEVLEVKRHLVCKRWTIERAGESSSGTPWFGLHRLSIDRLRFLLP